MKRNERAVKNLNAAIATMRNACEDAAREVARGPDEVAVQRVLHAFAWGFANASSGIESAMAAIEDAHAIEVDRMKRLRDKDSEA